MVDPTMSCPDDDDACLAPDSSMNATRGSTVKQPDADPFQEAMRKAMESRYGKATDVQSGMSGGEVLMPHDQ